MCYKFNINSLTDVNFNLSIDELIRQQIIEILISQKLLPSANINPYNLNLNHLATLIPTEIQNMDLIYNLIEITYFKLDKKLQYNTNETFSNKINKLNKSYFRVLESTIIDNKTKADNIKIISNEIKKGLKLTTGTKPLI